MATLTIADLDNGKRDLQTVDAVANSPQDFTTTRYGAQVLTLSGALRRLGYKAPVPYASGLTINSGLTTVSRGGVIYAPDPALVPFTTGAWDAAQWRVVQNTDDTNQVFQFNTLSEAQAAASTLPEGSAVIVDGVSQGNVVAGSYSPSAGTPAAILKDYLELRSYTGRASVIDLTTEGIAGRFVSGATTSGNDNGGTVIVGADGRKWRRLFSDQVNIRWFGAKGDGSTDDTAAIQAAINSLGSVSTLLFPDGNFVTTGALTVNAPNVTFSMTNNARVTYNVPSFIALNVTSAATGFTLTGGKWVGPSVWDGDNTSPSYAVLLINADRATVTTKLVNIRKVGIWFKDANECVATGCEIDGNYPSSQWTGVETLHYGILTDPNNGASGGNYRITNNTIRSCVQGLMAANYGTGGVIRGLVVTGNVFDGCWNHGIYSNYTNGAIITGNNFNRCQIPVVASGANNNISGNTMYTAVGTVGDQRDIVGISVRDPQNCVVANNTIKGVVVASAAVVINLQYFAVTELPLTGNIVTGNTIDITGGVANPIRIIGSSQYGSINTSGNIISSNTIRANIGSDGAILVDGIATGVNEANKVFGNSINIIGAASSTAATDGIRLVNQFAAEVYDNTVVYSRSATATVTCSTVAFLQTCQQCSSKGNSSVVDFRYGDKLNIVGTLESGSPTFNFARDNYNKVQTGLTATYTPVISVADSYMEVHEFGNGAPGFAARVGSTWRRRDGGTGATLYLKENGTGTAGWVAK